MSLEADNLVKLHKTVNGPMYLLETNTVICESLRRTGDYAPDEKALLGPLISNGDTILDVGANVGNHTLFFSQCVGHEGRVLSFEPQRFLFQILCANALLGRYQNVWPYRLAVGDQQGKVDIPVPNYFRPNNFGGYSLSFDTFKEQGDITTIDAIAPDQCRLMKIDVEGMELLVLKGAVETIARTRPFLYFEYNRPEFKEEILRFSADELHYRLYRHGQNVVGHHVDEAVPKAVSNLLEITPKTTLKTTKKIGSSGKIFVSIACFCDPDVVHTVNDCLDKAGSPARVEIGVCLQAKPNDNSYDALNDIAQVTVDRIDVTEARGPIYARARCEALMTDADYFLQIDCHSRFFSGWDEILIQEFGKALEFNDNAVLSHYPMNIKNMTSSDHLDRIGHVNRYRYIEADSIKSHGSLIKLPEMPTTSLGISAAMLFMRAEDRKRFPYDYQLDFGLHAAEQVLYAVRLWTHGFDIFCPTQHALATDYEGSRDRIPDEIKRISNANRLGWPEATWSKVKYLLGLDDIEQVDPVYGDSLDDSIARFGVGGERSLKSYYEFAGIHDKLKLVFPNYRYADD